MKKEKDYLELFRNLDAEIQMEVLAYIRVAYTAQETVKRQYDLLPDRCPAQVQEAQTGA